MTKNEQALALINEVIGWALGNDYMGYIKEIEEEYEITLDDALGLIENLLTNLKK